GSRRSRSPATPARHSRAGREVLRVSGRSFAGLVLPRRFGGLDADV
ncbi:MAG: hypothetical protein AVDCRST_MAG01-01-1677, partial [uncultured Rubrobacteraceae bacterium]